MKFSIYVLNLFKYKLHQYKVFDFKFSLLEKDYLLKAVFSMLFLWIFNILIFSYEIKIQSKEFHISLSLLNFGISFVFRRR